MRFSTAVLVVLALAVIVLFAVLCDLAALAPPP